MRVVAAVKRAPGRKGRRLAVAALCFTGIGYDVGDAVFGWPPIPTHLHRWVVSLSIASLLIVCLARIGTPAVEAFRLGISAGRREQRHECAAQCGHVCGPASDDTGEIRRRAVAGEVVVLANRRR